MNFRWCKMMKALVVLIMTINLLAACAASLSRDVSQNVLPATNTVAPVKQVNPAVPEKPVKSPHGYIITKDYELGRFGGFIGDCTSDTNWPYFWQCMSENAGNGGFK